MFAANCCSSIYLCTYFLFLDDSDDPEGLVRHLPTRLLKAGAQKRTKKRSAIGNRLEAATSDEEEDDDVPEVREAGTWSHQNTDMIGSRVPVGQACHDS
jgi:hypothetical protein